MPSEYIQRFPRGEIGGMAEDPDQQFSNSGGIMNENISTKTAVTIGIAANAGRKVITAGFNATVQQIGNTRLEQTIELAGKGFQYTALGIATLNPYVVGGAVLADLATNTIQQAVTNKKYRLENEYKEATRGTRTSLGGFYG